MQAIDASPDVLPAPARRRVRPPGRRGDLDVLRVAGMFTVFLVHVAQVFSPWQTWHIENAERAVWAGQLNLFAFPWVMPLFMFLAGAGACMALGRKRNGEYARERTLRLMLPFVIGTLLLVPPQIWVERLAQGRAQGGFLRFYPHFFECCYPEGNLAGGHLWFVVYLWVYALLAVPLFRWLGSPRGRKRIEQLSRIAMRPGGMLWLALPIALSQVALRGRWPQSLILIDDWANHGVLFLTYVYGYLLAAHGGLLAAARRQWRIALVPATAASLWLAVHAAHTTVPGILPLPYTAPYFLFWTLFGLASWSWIVVAVGASQTIGRRAQPALEYVSRAIYPFYMLHQTVIVLCAAVVVTWPFGVLPKFLALFMAALVATAGLTELARRWRPTRIALGMKGVA